MVRKVVLVAPCYKRPDIAARMLATFGTRTTIPFVGALIYLQPISCKPDEWVGNVAGWEGKRVLWVRTAQTPVSRARVLAVNAAIRLFPQADTILLTDDDVEAIPQTRLTEDMECLLDKPTTGLVSISRLMRPDQLSAADDIKREVFPYIGGGWFFNVDAYLDVNPEPIIEAGNEKFMGLGFYLSGRDNYRSRQSYAVHRQNGVESAHGGLRRVIAEYHMDPNSVRVPADTAYMDGHTFLVTKNPDRSKYGSHLAPYLTTSTGSRLTPQAKARHNENRARLLRRHFDLRSGS